MKTNLQMMGALVMFASAASACFAQGTAFTYQGRLDSGGAPAQGIYDLRFAIHDAPSGGSTVAGPITHSAPSITNGLFTVTLDFGTGIFTGAARWLEIGVRTNGGGTFMVLTPRQPLTPAPYALFAPNAGLSATATTASAVAANGVTTTSLQNNVVTSDKIADGTIAAADVNAASFDTTFWRTVGNAGTTPGTHFLGTTDNQPLELKVTGARVLRLEPGGDSIDVGTEPDGAPNIIAGASLNWVSLGVAGATISGGGATNYDGSLAINTVMSDYGTIGGGLRNSIQTNCWFSTIAGGDFNSIQPHATGAAVGGGVNNVVDADAAYATIAGGRYNRVGTSAIRGVIAGGDSNLIGAQGNYAAIGGGLANRIQAQSSSATIGGGGGNEIQEVAFGATIAGGQANTIQSNAQMATIGGGLQNTISSSDYGAAQGATIGGGTFNLISANAVGGTIGGGSESRLDPHAKYATVGGGRYNLVGNLSPHATVAGGIGNTVANNCEAAVISGGLSNLIVSATPGAAIGGGRWNTIGSSATLATIGGGFSNSVLAAATCATIPGGSQNTAASYALAAGRRAKALQSGCFVWADAHDADFTSTSTNQFLIRASGGVGIGTTSPQQALHVVGDAVVQGTNFTASGHTASLLLGDANHTVRSVYAGGLRLGVWPYPDALVIQDSSGNVGIGTSGPGQKLEVNGRIRMSTWTADGTTAVYKNANGDLGLQSSDLRLKKNIETIGNALDTVAGLRGVKFNWASEPDDAPKTVGLIAQEVRAAMPELTFEFRGEDGQMYCGVHYEKVAAVLANAVREQQGKIAGLEARVAKLEQLLELKLNGGAK